MRWLRAILSVVVLLTAVVAAPSFVPGLVCVGSAATAETTNVSPTPNFSRASSMPVDQPTRKKAGFLAGAGLLIISLLALGTALALVRSFKR